MDYTELASGLEEERIYLINHPEEISHHWKSSTKLFQFVGNTEQDKDRYDCGCLTMIATDDGFRFYAANNGYADFELTKIIKEDDRIRFKESVNITVESLPVFKKWQLGIRQYFDGNMTLDELRDYVR